MRISGGRARGITLQVPRGDAVRPATDGTRQSVFSSLAGRLPEARFLDLFAGSGSYGLEALSRGAAGGIAVEKSPKALACLRANRAAVTKSVGVAESVLEIIPVDLLAWRPVAPVRADLVFIDPPYDQIEALAPILFRKLDEWLVGASDPVLVFEMPGEIVLTDAVWEEVKRVGRGGPRQPTVALFRRREAGSTAGAQPE